MSKRSTSFTILLFVLAVVLLLASTTSANPVMMAYYRRQQCERSFQICQLAAMGESFSLLTGINELKCVLWISNDRYRITCLLLFFATFFLTRQLLLPVSHLVTRFEKCVIRIVESRSSRSDVQRLSTSGALI